MFQSLTAFLFVWVRSFSLPDFVSEVQEAIRPVLSAYMKASLSVFEIDEIVCSYIVVSFSTALFFKKFFWMLAVPVTLEVHCLTKFYMAGRCWDFKEVL